MSVFRGLTALSATICFRLEAYHGSWSALPCAMLYQINNSPVAGLAAYGVGHRGPFIFFREQVL